MQKVGRYVKTNLWQNLYLVGLLWIILIHLIFITLLDFMWDEDDKDVTNVSSSEYVTMISLVFLEWIFIIFQCKVLYKYIFLTDIKPIFCLYLSKIVAFGDIYLLLFKIHAAQFHHPDNVLITSTTYRDIAFTLLNYSASLQTLTGISPVTPRKGASEFLSAAQVLLFGIGYGVFILSIAVLRFAQTDVTPQSLTADISDVLNLSQTIPVAKPESLLTEHQQKASINSITQDMFPLTAAHAVQNNYRSPNAVKHLLTKSKIKCIKNYLRYARFYYRFMMLILICVQTPRLVLMYKLCDLDCADHPILTVGIVFDCVLLSLCIVSGAIRMRLIRRLGIRVNISIVGLIRSYLTVLLQFGLLYFDVWVLTKDRKRSAFNVIVKEANVHNYWAMIGHFLYFSTTTFTNVGAEAAITTRETLGQFLNATQMILGVIYHTVVFGVSLLDISSHRMVDTERFVQSQTQDVLGSEKKTNTLREVGLIQRQIKQIVVQNASNRNNGLQQYVHPSISNLSIDK
eukprot:124886_1